MYKSKEQVESRRVDCLTLTTLDNHFPDVDTVVVAARQLGMAIGAVRAAGIAAVALGYHFWKLLTKQDDPSDEDRTEEVQLFTCCGYAAPVRRVLVALTLLTLVHQACSDQGHACSL